MSILEQMNTSYDDIDDFSRSLGRPVETVARGGVRRRHLMNASVNLEKHKARIN